MDINGLFGIIGIVAGIVLLLPLVVGAIFVIVVVSNRAEPDPTGRRPAVVYSFAVSFITLFVTLFSSFVVVSELCSLIGTRQSGSGSVDISGFDPSNPGGIVIHAGGIEHAVGDAVARGVVVASLLAIVAGVMYLIHLRAGERGTAGVAFADPAGRVRSSYVAAVSFVCVMIIVISVVIGVYQVFRLAGPGVFNSGGHGDRTDAVRTLLPLIYLAAATFYLLRRHSQQLPPSARPSFLVPRSPSPSFIDTEASDGPTEVEVLEA
jgi:hypothetical protein